jgi:hypothetical protein
MDCGFSCPLIENCLCFYRLDFSIEAPEHTGT